MWNKKGDPSQKGETSTRQREKSEDEEPIEIINMILGGLKQAKFDRKRGKQPVEKCKILAVEKICQLPITFSKK